MKKIAIVLAVLLLAISLISFTKCDNCRQQANINSTIPTTTTKATTTTATTATTMTTTTTTATQKTENTEEAECWISGSVVNMRSGPGMEYEVLTRLERGTKVIKTGESGEWFRIEYQTMQGYVHGDYVSMTPLPSESDGEVVIIVKKAERKLELWQGDTLIGSYRIGLGWAPVGHKQVEGDGKTPEGEYYVCTRNANGIYYKSLGVSYPNEKDAAAALDDGRIDKSTYDRIARAIRNGQCPDWYTPLGGNILIHGLGGDSDWTAGCVGVDNYVMDILFEYCKIGTKIIIYP